jgi:hypothetical protein
MNRAVQHVGQQPHQRRTIERLPHVRLTLPRRPTLHLPAALLHFRQSRVQRSIALEQTEDLADLDRLPRIHPQMAAAGVRIVPQHWISTRPLAVFLLLACCTQEEDAGPAK